MHPQEQHVEAQPVDVASSNVAAELEQIIADRDTAPRPQTPIEALRHLGQQLTELETTRQLPADLGSTVEGLTETLRLAAHTTDLDHAKAYRRSADAAKLSLNNPYFVGNASDRDIHTKILAYLNASGVVLPANPAEHMAKHFERRDQEKKLGVMQSYAQHGLLTLTDGRAAGVLHETSSTPGDSSAEHLADVTEASGSLRGYELTDGAADAELFTGRNGFFQVALERGGEDIDRASFMPRAEVENRLRGTMMILVNSDKVDMTRRAGNPIHEDTVSTSIPADRFTAVLVSESNLPLAQATFGRHGIRVIGVPSVPTQVNGLYDGDYAAPDYQTAASHLIREEGSQWAHITRLPLDTYPQS